MINDKQQSIVSNNSNEKNDSNIALYDWKLKYGFNGIEICSNLYVDNMKKEMVKGDTIRFWLNQLRNDCLSRFSRFSRVKKLYPCYLVLQKMINAKINFKDLLDIIVFYLLLSIEDLINNLIMNTMD